MNTKRLALCAIIALTLFSGAAGQANAGPIISVGSFPATVPSYMPPLPAGAFLVPVEISGAGNLQSWQFDLLFDNTVVEEVDTGDGSSGIYGAEFVPGDPNSTSFILSGFPFNFLGEVDTVAGEYPSLLTGPSGDGILAFIVFDFLEGQENGNPNFSIPSESVTVVQGAPEPATLVLLASGLALLGTRRRMNGRRGDEC